jgi:hypothetical protein
MVFLLESVVTAPLFNYTVEFVAQMSRILGKPQSLLTLFVLSTLFSR